VTAGLHFKSQAQTTPKFDFYCIYKDPSTGLSVSLPVSYMSADLHHTDVEHLDSASHLSGFPDGTDAWARVQSDGVKFVSVWLSRQLVRADCQSVRPDNGDSEAFNEEACRWYAAYLLGKLPALE
jgi:hypothetical protein